jgi:hypothetical protein
MEGLPRSPPIPVHNYKVALQLPLEGMREEHHRHPWTPVQEQNYRLGTIAASNENPLLNSSDQLLLQ